MQEPDKLIRDDLSDKDRKRVEAIVKPVRQFEKPEQFERMQAGALTSLKTPNHNAFSHPSANLSFESRQDFFVGNGLFKKIWVSSPSSTLASDGLGPLYNARSCQRCHIKDGRGQPPQASDDVASSLIIKLGQGDGDENPVTPDPVYGRQLQTFGVSGVPAEANVRISYQNEVVTYPDGEQVTLKRPRINLDDPAYGAFSEQLRVSARIAPPMIGLGLIEAIHPADIVENADPSDEDGDGVSGRLAWLDEGRQKLGLFGWKATTATVEQQSANAFSGDIGISTPLVPDAWGDCTQAQEKCISAWHGVQKRLGETEAPDPVLPLVVFYSRNLAVPARRDVGDSDVLAGKEIFYKIGCVGCHKPKFVTSRKADDKQAFQLIWPYSDFLLHDMGDDLADNFPEGAASGREWRTPPLWGIGLTKTVNEQANFLHDGRAGTLEEAILWHGGEAKAVRDRFINLDKISRKQLVRFLSSL